MCPAEVDAADEDPADEDPADEDPADEEALAGGTPVALAALDGVSAGVESLPTEPDVADFPHPVSSASPATATTANAEPLSRLIIVGGRVAESVDRTWTQGTRALTIMNLRDEAG